LRERQIPVVVIAPLSVENDVASHGLTLRLQVRREDPWRQLSPSAVLATTHSSGSGEFGWHLASEFGVPYFVVQHGVVTPFAPPLPREAHLLAWSGDDARFWTSSRRDVATTVVGSQIIWNAGHAKSNERCADDPVCFLGQLHGPELARSVTLRTVSSLSRMGPLVYRLHPAEKDKISRLVHSWWKSRGISIQSPERALADSGGPVAGIFSTGILEAAAAGRDSFCYCVRPPRWLTEFWDRYGMAPLGATCSTHVDLPDAEPASSIADLVADLA
jgi:hypothetical protein